VLPIPSSERRGDSQVEVVFDGGLSAGDAGHGQDRYIDFVAGTSDPLVVEFLGTLATGTAIAGTAIAGTAIAVDVSAPGTASGAQKT
jgi:hypothetical protein